MFALHSLFSSETLKLDNFKQMWHRRKASILKKKNSFDIKKRSQAGQSADIVKMPSRNNQSSELTETQIISVMKSKKDSKGTVSISEKELERRKVERDNSEANLL